MGNVFIEISAPAYWQDFERITLDLFKIVWRDDYAERNGRSGQKQKGVDVYGYNNDMKERTGVQCKKRKYRLAGVEAPGHSLTAEEVDAAHRESANFGIELDRFIIATTGERDEDLQAYVRTFNNKGVAPVVSLGFWDNYVEELNARENLMYRYYHNILKYREQYSGDEHYYRMLAMAFDRPAIRTAIHPENRAVDFIEAISNLPEAIATGVLKDRDGRVIDEIRVPGRKKAQLRRIQTLLQKTRDAATDGLKHHVIEDLGTVVEIRDHRLADTLNDNRSNAVERLNEVLAEHGIDKIDFVTY